MRAASFTIASQDRLKLPGPLPDCSISLYVIEDSAAGRARSTATILAMLTCILVSLTGCEVVAAPVPTPIATSLPTITPTTDVTFRVGVAPIVQRKHHRAKPTPQPTRFVAPPGPYLVLHPDFGPPVDNTIVVSGGHFPHSVAISILWALSGRLTPLSTIGYSDPHGGLRAALSIPASAPGVYRVQAEVQGVPYARAEYHIVSAASLAASVTPTSSGGTLSILGKKFVPGFQLTLIAYSTIGTRKPIVLGNVQVNSYGRFTFSRPMDQLQPGQYILRAWSASSVAAEMAQTFFEVVV
jgi:hypothetical protein